jgi:hypothetical protein
MRQFTIKSVRLNKSEFLLEHSMMVIDHIGNKENNLQNVQKENYGKSKNLLFLYICYTIGKIPIQIGRVMVL